MGRQDHTRICSQYLLLYSLAFASAISMDCSSPDAGRSGPHISLRAKARDFTIDLRPARFGAFEIFQDEDSRAFRNHPRISRSRSKGRLAALGLDSGTN